MNKAKNIQPKVEDSDLDSQEEVPVPVVKSTKKQQVENKKANKKVAKPEVNQDADAPVVQKKPVKQIKTEGAPVKKVKKIVKEVENQQEAEKAVEAVEVSKPKIKAAKKVSSPAQIPIAPKKSVVLQQADEEGEFEVIVKGLSFQASDNAIKEFFDQCGNVSNVKLLMRDGQSKGLAFVKFSKKSSFNKAIALNGSEHMGRNLKIEEALGKRNNEGEQGNFGQKREFNNSRDNNNRDNNRGFENNRDNNRGKFDNNKGDNRFPAPGSITIETPTLFIGGLSFNSSVDSITEFFSPIGNVTSARIVTDRQTGKARGFGYVEFNDVESAKKAYQTLNGGNLDGRTIRLDNASQRDKPAGGNQGGFGGNQGGYKGNQGGFGGNQGGFGNRGAPRNQGNSTVILSQDDKNAKKGAIGAFKGKKMTF